LVANIYKTLLENVEQVQKKQHKVYVARKRLQLFEGFEEGDTKVKMHKLGKKRNLMGSWEGPYDFVSNKDGKGCQEQDEGSTTCMIKDLDGKCWEKARRDF
jgi:L-rhamnose mutarotase